MCCQRLAEPPSARSGWRPRIRAVLPHNAAYELDCGSRLLDAIIRDGVTGAPLRTGNGSAIRHKISQGPAGNGAVGRRGFAGDLEALRPGKLFSACIGLLHKVAQVVLKRDRALQRAQ